MNKETLTVHEALAELKMLDSRIKNHISLATFAVINKHSNSKIDGMPVSDYIQKQESEYQSIMDLIRRRKAIRNALSQSNAVTKVIIGGKEYTVAEAIEMKKTGMENIEGLLNALVHQNSLATSAAGRDNERLIDRADQYIIGLMGGKDKTTSSDAVAIRQAYIDSNTSDVVTISNIEDIIRSLHDEIDAFNSEVDAKISISNALTTIEFEY